MLPAVSLSLDSSLAEAALRSLAGVMEQQGFPRTVKKAAQVYSRSIDLNITTGGRPEKFAELKPSTIRARHAKAKRTGRRPVAGWETPLRETDTMRKAATATRPGVFGSAFEDGKRNLSIGINGQEIPQARRIQEGFGTMPARPFILAQEEDNRQIIDVGRNELNQYAQRFNMGGF